MFYYNIGYIKKPFGGFIIKGFV